MEFKCSMCPFFCGSHEQLLAHMVKRHRHSPFFIAHCNIPGCGSSYKNYLSFKRHVYSKHPNVTRDFAEGVSQLVCSTTSDQHDNDDGNDKTEAENESIAKSEAAFLLKLKVCHKVTDVACNEIMQSMKDMYKTRIDFVQKIVQKSCPGICFPPELFGTHMFEQVDTTYKQNKFFKEKFGMNMPVPIKLGEKFVCKRVGSRRKIVKTDVFGYVVPFLQQVETLLSMPEMVDILADNHSERPDLVTDVAQGSYLSSHELVVNNRDVLLFSLYYDDYELVNPIGSHRKKHKQAVFYFQLLNIPPEFCGKLATIQLVACAKSNDIKQFGFDRLLSDFVDGLQKLYDGYTFTVCGSPKLCHGLLVYVLGDTLAAQMLGGFKEGVGSARKPCRTCEISREDLPLSRTSDDFPKRDEQEHRDRCNLLGELSTESKVYWSQQYGINRTSFLAAVPGFHITECILHDPMHILLEGVDRIIVKLLLSRLIMNDKYFTLDDLNTAISNYNYSRTDELDKPRMIEKSEILSGGSLSQSAASMRVLLYHLPFLIGDFVPNGNKYWHNFIILLQINILCFSPYASYRTVCSLRTLIASHNKNFVALYPEASFIPKLHYLTHLTEQLRLFGPLRHHSCMRFEAKHGFIKAKKWSNFKCIEKSVAEYHQRWMCLQQVDETGKKVHNFLYQGDEVKSGVTMSLNALPFADIFSACQSSINLPDDTLVMVSPEVKVNGLSYTPGCVLVWKWPSACEPQLLEVQSVIVHDHDKYLVCKTLEVVGFSAHLNSFVVENGESAQTMVVQVHSLYSAWPQIVYMSGNCKYVMMHCVDDVWTE